MKKLVIIMIILGLSLIACKSVESGSKQKNNWLTELIRLDIKFGQYFNKVTQSLLKSGFIHIEEYDEEEIGVDNRADRYSKLQNRLDDKEFISHDRKIITKNIVFSFPRDELTYLNITLNNVNLEELENLLFSHGFSCSSKENLDDLEQVMLSYNKKVSKPYLLLTPGDQIFLRIWFSQNETDMTDIKKLLIYIEDTHLMFQNT